MHAFFVHGKRRCRKARFGERADRDCDMCFISFARIVHGGTALRAETERGSASFITNANVGGRFAANLNGVSGEPRLRAEYTPSSALAGQAMTDRDADWLLAHRETKLATTAGGGTKRHMCVMWVDFFCCLTTELSRAVGVRLNDKLNRCYRWRK